jgi:hypothetical protein
LAPSEYYIQGCQWVLKPVLSPLLYKSKPFWGNDKLVFATKECFKYMVFSYLKQNKILFCCIFHSWSYGKEVFGVLVYCSSTEVRCSISLPHLPCRTKKAVCLLADGLNKKSKIYFFAAAASAGAALGSGIMPN